MNRSSVVLFVVMSSFGLLFPATGFGQSEGVQATGRTKAGPSLWATHRIVFEVRGRAKDTTVTVEGVGSCEAPCGLDLPSGSHVVTVGSTSTFSKLLDVPDDDAWVSIEAPNTRQRTAGITCLVLSVPLFAGAVGLGYAAATARCNGGFLCLAEMTRNFSTLGAVFLGAGGVILVSSGIYNVAKAHDGRLTVSPSSGASTKSPLPGLRLSAFGVSPIRGGAAASAAFEF